MNTMLFSVRPYILRLLEEGPAPLFWVPLPVPIPCPPSALIAGLFSFTLIQILYSFSYFYLLIFFFSDFLVSCGSSGAFTQRIFRRSQAGDALISAETEQLSGAITSLFKILF